MKKLAEARGRFSGAGNVEESLVGTRFIMTRSEVD